MKFWKNPAAKAMVLWMTAFAAMVLFAWLMKGCADPSVPKSTPCLPDIQDLVDESANCNEAQIKVDVLLRYSSTCRGVFGDAGLELCAKVKRDAGKDAGHD